MKKTRYARRIRRPAATRRQASRRGRVAERLVVDQAGRPEPDGERQRAPGPSTRSSSASVVRVGDRDVVGLGERLAVERRPHRRRAARRPTARRPPSVRAPRASARWRTGAAARCAGVRWTLRDESARPSGSRTVGQAMTSVGIARSQRHPADDHHLLGVLLAEVRRARRRRGRTGSRRRSRRRRSGRAAPRPRAAGRPPRRRRRVEARRIDLVDASGAKTRSTPSASQIAMSRASLRGYLVKSAATLNWRGLTKIDDDGRGVAGAGPPHQRPMAVVEPAHRRDEADRPRGRASAARSSARVRTTTRQRPGDPRSERAERIRGRGRAGSRRPGSSARGRSDAPRPSTSSRTASSIRTVSLGPGKVPAATSAA